MMQTKRLKRVLLTSLVAIALLGLSLGAWAATGSQELTAIFRDIQIIVNGSRVTPTDANGQAVEPFLVDGTTYLPVRAVADALGLEVGWDEGTSTVSLSGTAGGASRSGAAAAPSAEMARNLATVQAFLAESSNAAWAGYFAAGALYQYSGADSYRDVDQCLAEEWLAGLAADFLFANPYAVEGVEPIFTPLTEAASDSILVKAVSPWTEEDETFAQDWILEFNFDENGQIYRFRQVKDPDDTLWRQMRADGEFAYRSSLDAETRHLLNMHTMDLWWACQDLDRNIQRLILVTDDAAKLMDGVKTIMYVTDADGNYLEGWLNPDQSGAFPTWGFFRADLTNPPDRIFACADLPDVYLVDGYGEGTWYLNGELTPLTVNYYLQFTFRDDGLICNFRELSHGLHTLPAL